MKVIDHYINKIRSAIAWINHSNLSIVKFKKYCKAKCLKDRKFGLDMTIRWNSTYLMLKTTIEYKNVITVFYNSKIVFAILHNFDWLIVENFVQFLDFFFFLMMLLLFYLLFIILLLLLVLHNIFEITNMFLMNGNDELFKPMLEVMEKKFKNIAMEFLYCILLLLF